MKASKPSREDKPKVDICTLLPAFVRYSKLKIPKLRKEKSAKCSANKRASRVRAFVPTFVQCPLRICLLHRTKKLPPIQQKLRIKLQDQGRKR